MGLSEGYGHQNTVLPNIFLWLSFLLLSPYTKQSLIVQLVLKSTDTAAVTIRNKVIITTQNVHNIRLDSQSVTMYTRVYYR